ncbi:hypothetical protein BO71DRAFT_412199 [Aspergillus ellipticus CBS 707.79]|uniref:C2H2-type domain-containing protein n=1 Tax=Aspergillus ellipticus CBS 707.79 TaxID=1448320 RepID=A0A319D1P1_9EURO|nr:hypothetical protein BO71DRAFT_412199 [Aspergillus ellipticus CBS 707.79]
MSTPSDRQNNAMGSHPIDHSLDSKGKTPILGGDKDDSPKLHAIEPFFRPDNTKQPAIDEYGNWYFRCRRGNSNPMHPPPVTPVELARYVPDPVNAALGIGMYQQPPIRPEYNHPLPGASVPRFDNAFSQHALAITRSVSDMQNRVPISEGTSHDAVYDASSSDSSSVSQPDEECTDGSNQTYRCEWKDCTSEQEYKDTSALIEHIGSSHLGQELHTCKWQGCTSGPVHKTHVALYQHIRRTHLNRKLGVYKCEWIDCTSLLKSKYPHQILKHIRQRHVDPDAFRCWVLDCGKTYSSRYYLKRHLRRLHKIG